ncbi:cytochrome P450 [Yaniella sp.]|uniref:cytochrome P450 n=1 Tax=Yaniella sp. TaxID=2773929 RepID=UPI00264747F6|nr:cytochrome P450 [Yaniella sp.]MDN6358811.1 cytochrome P450/oxidoreductase [Yaniella sp.]
MTTVDPQTRPMGRCPVAHGFDVMGDEYYEDPSAHLARFRHETPVFWYEPLNAWVVTTRKDSLEVLSDWQAFSSASNSAADVPERHHQTYPPELVAKMIVGMDPPEHTEARSVAQRGFTKDKMDRLQPEIEARAHRIIDRFEERGTANLLEEYSLELTTQTIMALLGLGYEYEDMLRQLRDDLFAVLSSAHAPMEEPEKSTVWDRFVNTNLVLRELIEQPRESDADAIISVMASAKDPDGSYTLSTEQIGLHVSEFSAAGTDTTAQAMTNAVLFLSQYPDSIEEELVEPELWANVFEETIRRRPSSTFTSRKTTRSVTLSGVDIPAGDMIFVALASANTDTEHVHNPFEFDIHRPDPTDHLAFTAGRHTCLGNPLARVQGTTGLQVLFERLPSLRADEDPELDFARLPLLPIRRSLHVHWDVADVHRNRSTTVRTLNLTVADRVEVTDSVAAISLEHPDGGELPRWQPGAHIDVHLTDDTGTEWVRQYSLASDPADQSQYRIGVLREDDGRGGSVQIHQALQPGTPVTVSWPRNNFRLASAQKYLFIAGGIGITPLMSMIRAAEAAGADWQLHYTGRSQDKMAFLDELERYGAQVQLYPKDDTGRLQLDQLLADPEENCLIYVCGPETLMQQAEEQTQHWPKEALRLERFAPKPITRTEPDSAFEVEFTDSGLTVEVGPEQSILEAAAAAGMPVISSCEEGTCGTCETPVVSGEIDHRDSILSPSEQDASKTMMICVSRAKGACPLLALKA